MSPVNSSGTPRQRRQLTGNPAAVIRYLTIRLRDSSPHSGEIWTTSIFPSSTPDSRLYILADGLASSSTALPGREFVPWLNEVGPIITGADPSGLVGGLSYCIAEPRVLHAQHYGPSDTDIALNEDASDLFSPYAPVHHSNQKVTYLGFSLGANLLSLGLAGYLARLVQPPTEPSIPSLILIQPVISLGAPYVASAQDPRVVGRLPHVIRDLVYEGLSLVGDLLSSLQTATKNGVKVSLIYWEGDEFIKYPRRFMNYLTDIGVSVTPVSYLADPEKSSFIEHCNAATNPEVLARIGDVIAGLI